MMTSKVMTIEGNRTVLEAARLMIEKSIGSLVVTKGDVPVGILTESDIVEKICLKDLQASKVDVEDIMSKPLETAEPDLPVEIAIQRMTNSRIRRLPVVKNGKLVGILTVTDLARYLRKNLMLDSFLSTFED
jgi:CBS domain-containing protein